jgi:hypothetical protein
MELVVENVRLAPGAAVAMGVFTDELIKQPRTCVFRTSAVRITVAWKQSDGETHFNVSDEGLGTDPNARVDFRYPALPIEGSFP